jgi:hypothetical protein
MRYPVNGGSVSQLVVIYASEFEIRWQTSFVADYASFFSCELTILMLMRRKLRALRASERWRIDERGGL